MPQKRTKSKGLQPYQVAIDVRLRRLERSLYRGLKQDLATDFDNLGELAAKTFTDRAHLLDFDVIKSKGLKAKEEDTAAKVVLAMDIEGWTKEHLQETLKRSALQSFHGVRDTVSDTLRIELDPHGTIQHDVVRELGTRKGLPDIEDGTKKAIVRAIEQGRKEGMATDQIANLIKREVPKGRFVNAGKKYRAEMIARTETRFAVNKSSMELYRNSNEITAVTAIDGEDDDDCRERNGTQFTFDAAEEENAKTHPNCTLRFVPVVAG